MSLNIVTPPEYIGLNPKKISIFLGGSIEAGKARDWQQDIAHHIENKEYSSAIELLNPRRASWDASWPMDDPDHKELAEQINWELYYQDKADILIYYFATGTISPITLLELGTYAGHNPLIYIEGGYKRHANVKITADHFGWEYYENHDAFLNALDKRISLQVAFKHNILVKP